MSTVFQISRSNPNLQESKVVGVSTESTTGIYDFPECSLWELKANPLDGDITYEVINYSKVVGKEIEISKELDTTATTHEIKLKLPLGCVFNETGNEFYVFGNNAQNIKLTFYPDLTVSSNGGLSHNSSFRAGVDPVSNPDPNIGGLIVTAAETAGNNFFLPIKTSTQFIPTPMDNYIDDPNSDYTVSGSSITFNVAGKFALFFNAPILANAAAVITAQLLNTTSSLFSAPPAATDFTILNSTGVIFPNPFFAFGGAIGGCATISTLGGETIGLALKTTDDIVVSLTSTVCIHRIA